MDPQLREQTVDYLADLLAEKTDRRFCEELLSETFCIPFTTLHDRIFRVLASDCKQKLILAPRTIGKTSLVRAVILKALLFKLKRFVVYIGNSATLAEMQTENLKFELLNNKFILKAFGDVRESVAEADYGEFNGIEVDESFSKKAWVAFGRTLVLPRGCGQQIRGLNWRGFRPDLIVLDDPENRKEIRNEDNRAENKRWLFGDVLQSVDSVRKTYDIIYIDTLKHEDALPVSLMEMGGWEFDKLAICDEKLHSYAPGFKSDDELKLMVEQYTVTGDLDVFYQEYMNIPTAPTTASFKREYFKYFREGDKDVNWIALETVIICDPAKSITPQSDWTGLCALSADYSNHKILVRQPIGDHFYPDQMFEKAVAMADAFGTKVIGVEVTSLNMFITYPFRTYLMMHGRTDIQIVELKAIRKKEERIAALIPFYRRGLIYHNKSNCRDLETQLMSFPHSRRDDIMDAEAYFIEMFNLGERFFFGTEDLQTGTIVTPAMAAAKAAKEKGDDLTEAELIELEYEELEDEPALEYSMHDDILTGDIHNVCCW